MVYQIILKEGIEAFLDFIYPRNIYCMVCGRGIEKKEAYALCAACRNKISFVEDKACEKCGKPLSDFYFLELCLDCIGHKHDFTKGFSCVAYDDEMKQLVHRLKYKKERYLAYHMAEMMTDKLRKQGIKEIDCIIPVPLYKRKQRQREFNQAQILAMYIGKNMGWVVDCKNLIRIKDTVPQNALSKEERRNNLKDAFRMVSQAAFMGKTILLVDDVYTTGSTVDACSQELMKAKPKEIFVISFATGRNM
ncbi:ComF family protein [Clostridiaceae bacterium 35-E11]